MKTLSFALIPALLLVSACDEKKVKAPTGQVVATVNGKELTVMDLRQEANSPTPSKELEQAALKSIVIRRLLADEAVKQGLNKIPATAIMEDKARQMVLVDALTGKIRSTVPAPSADEARQYVASHPASFNQRRIFLVDQLIVLANTPELVKAIEPLDTMAQIEDMLTRQKVQFRRSVGAIDALTINADVAEKIAQLPPNAVFASPEGAVIRVNRIRETIIEPITGATAEKLALEMITKQRTDAIVANEVGRILQQGEKSVQYNAAYDPAKNAVKKSDSSQ